MAHKASHITVIQVDGHMLSLLRARRTAKGIETEAYACEQGEWLDQNGLAASLRGFIERHGAAGDEIYSVLPRHDMTVRILVLPSHDPSEIEGMVRLSAEEYVPYPVEELIVDQAILALLPDGHARVLAVFAHRDVVHTHVGLLREAGVEPRAVFVSTACLASAALAGAGTGHYAVVNLSGGGLEAVVFRGGCLEYGRGVATAQDWEAMGEDTEAAQELSMETRSSLAAYRRESEDGTMPETLYLASEWADVGGAAQLLGETAGLTCAPVPWVSRLVSGGSVLKGHTPLVALGAVLAAQGRAAVTIDLTPPVLRHKRDLARSRARVLRAVVAAVGIVALFAASYGLAFWQRMSYLTELERELAIVEPVAEQVRQKERNLKLLQGRVDRSGSAVELLARLGELAPPTGLSFVRFTYERGKIATLQGRVVDPAEASRFSERIRQAGESDVPFFRQAQLGKSTEVVERAMTVMQFDINMPFPGAEAGDEVAE